MFEPSSDPPDARMLFSPVSRSGREPSSDAPVPADTPVSTEHSPPPRRNRVSFFIHVPYLSDTRKAEYCSVAEDYVQPDEYFAHEGVDQIVGESQEGRELFFYVRYEEGLIYKVLARPFRKAYPDLVERYEKDKNKLPPFDPSAPDVHPTARQDPLKVKIPSAKSRTSRSFPDYSSDELAEDMSDEYSESSDAPARRSTRAAAATANKKLGSSLPFSPKKTRASGAIVVHGSDSDSDVQEASVSVRKSTRARKTRRANLDDEDFEDYSSAEELDKNIKAPKKKIVRGKASRPAYGHFRVVADLAFDEEDEDVAPLIAHRSICEKCHTAPTHEQLGRKKGRKRKAREDDSEDEDARVANLGGWVRCLKCPVAAHWGCLAATQRQEILRAAHERDKAEWKSTNSNLPEPSKRPGLEPYQTTEFICGSCMKGGICMGCKEVALKADQAERAQSAPAQALDVQDPSGASVHQASNNGPGINNQEVTSRELLFRCFTCKRLAHYAHLPLPDEFDPDGTEPIDLARYYQHDTGWKCADCFSYVYHVDQILAWRPYPSDAVEPPRAADEPPDVKAMLPREYLIKWVDRSYRRLTWVPHGWLRATAPQKLKNFLQAGTKVALLPEPVAEQQGTTDEVDVATFEIGGDEDGLPSKVDEGHSNLDAFPDAEKRIPPAWRTVDRVLDIRLWKPQKASKGKGKGKRTRVETSDDEDSDGIDPSFVAQREWVYDHGEEPPATMLATIEEFEALVGRKLNENDARRVAWAFFKWNDRGYDEATWDSPPRRTEVGYSVFEKAFSRFVFARSVTVPSRNKSAAIVKTGKEWLLKQHFTTDSLPDLGQNPQFKLMPFQVEGVNWLCHNWNIDQNCILADEMGLGKTVQVVTYIGYIASKYKAYPALVVVPNSTITNWVREFERWAPKLRVVPFYGEAKSREIIKRYELSHDRPALGTTGAKYHVLVTTYETVINPKDFGPVFKSTPRWEMLVVDEGQRLKSDESLIFKRLRELNSFHRVIMTGTPLNNNIRELFNLMNFLNPDDWKDLEALSKQYEELTEDLVKELHVKLKPYFLRRIKSEVLQLPPKNEVIVPVSMAPLQKEIYRSVLSQNFDILRSLAEGNSASSKSNNITKTRMSNILMQLRKCLQHPYLVDEHIEPRGLSPEETHERLIGASAKLRLLKMLLPKLRARGHRVLLFSQFVIALDIIEDFLAGEGIKFLRLDGNTKQAERQKGMDEFNKPDSDVFIYILSTRAGGVGINLWSADTVIIFDPDFNPHQDLQAIARAHRYGQQKTVLVFKLMVKESAEERIMQTGKKKLVLDHLIVQKMDDEDGSKEDVQSILMFGAKALFEETEESVAREIHYTEHDIDSLIEKTEKEGDVVEPESNAGSLFAFAKVWSADKEGLVELSEDVPEYPEEADSWAKALELIAARKATEQEKEVTGRGARRKAAAVFPQQSIHLGDTPTKPKDKSKSKKRKKSKGKSSGSDDSDFHVAVSNGSDSDNTVDAAMDVDDFQLLPAPGSSYLAPQGSKPAPKHDRRHPHTPHRPLSPIQNRQHAPEVEGEFCGLCGKQHSPGRCSMTESPENLAQYRLMLMQHAGDESIEERRAAIRVIDETLHRLGKIHLIYGQPLHLVESPSQPTASRPSKKPKVDEHGSQPVAQPKLHGSAVARNIPHGTHPIAGPSRLNGAPVKAATAAKIPEAIPHISKPLNGMASSSKYPAMSATQMITPAQKPTLMRGNCVVCGRVPHHLVKDCPVVAQGPSSIAEAIERLSKTPEQADVVSVLRNILTKYQRRALAASAAQSSKSGSTES